MAKWMNKRLLFILVIAGFTFQQCRVARDLSRPEAPSLTGKEGLEQLCLSLDTIQSILISKAEAIILSDNERYEVTVTLFSRKDSIIYLSAVNSGFEILRASVDPDSIKVIDRLNKTIYRTPLNRRFGFQNPVNFRDLQNIISRYYLCDDLLLAREDSIKNLSFEFKDKNIKKSIHLERTAMRMTEFEFVHLQTGEYLLGRRKEDGFWINSNFMINNFDIVAGKGSVTYNQEIAVNMIVNPRKYSFIEL